MTYTLFWDMHSGSGQKEKWSKIIIEAPEEEAKIIFYNRFGHSPDRVTCTCCGEDYSTYEDDNLFQLIAYHLGAKYDSEAQIYLNQKDKSQDWRGFVEFYTWLDDPEHMTPNDGSILLIEDKDILDEERIGDLPMQGYVWIE